MKCQSSIFSINKLNVPDNHTDYLITNWKIDCTISTRATKFILLRGTQDTETRTNFEKFVPQIDPTGNRTQDLLMASVQTVGLPRSILHFGT